MNNKTILHIIVRDKFTAGYINFMKMHMTGYRHYFVTFASDQTLRLVDNDNVLYICHHSEILKNKNVRRLLFQSDQIIVSGLFNFQMYLGLFPNCIIRKIYIQFWGGDLYGMLKAPINRHDKISNFMKKRLMEHCASIINLIPDDYRIVKQILGKEKSHVVAPMPSDPLKTIDFSAYRNTVKKSNCVKINIGNSATEENRHIGILQLLEQYKSENIEIYAPLSYGDMNYRKTVIKEGNKIFGEKFHPILEMMEYEKYVEYLASCDITISNSLRQQGMGNLSLMLQLGKKVFMNQNSPMWDSYKNIGFKIYDTNSIDKLSFHEFTAFDAQTAKENIKCYEREKNINVCIAQWNYVLEGKSKS